MEVDIQPLGADDLPRAAQLTQRTNQFNATTIRRGEATLSAWIKTLGQYGFSVRVKDRFGDYGFVGLALAQTDGPALRVTDFMLSCRVLGRQVEHAILRHLVAIATENALDRLLLTMRPTERNELI